jgi:hypothetical protein
MQRYSVERERCNGKAQWLRTRSGTLEGPNRAARAVRLYRAPMGSVCHTVLCADLGDANGVATEAIVNIRTGACSLRRIGRSAGRSAARTMPVQRM